MSGYRVVERHGDGSTTVIADGYPSVVVAEIAAADLNSTTLDRDLFVDGPGILEPIPVDAGRTMPDRLFRHPSGRWTL